MDIRSEIANSLRTRGPIRTIAVMIHSLMDFFFDLRYGTDTRRWVGLHQLTIPSQNRLLGVDYIPTRTRAFRNIMNRVNFPDKSTFVDLGCGKGKILLLAADFRFNRVVGVDFSSELCEIARRNLNLYGRKKRIKTPIAIVHADVVEYPFGNDENVFYLFDPFGPTVLGQILKNLDSSLQRAARKIWLIYHEPLYRDIIDRHGGYLLEGDYFYGGSEFLVYSHRV